MCHLHGAFLPEHTEDHADGSPTGGPTKPHHPRGLIPWSWRPATHPADGTSEPNGGATIERIRLARRLQALGLTLDEVIDALHATDQGDATCASERWRLEAVLERIDAKVTELRAVRREITKVMGACDRGECVFADDEIGA